MSPIPLSFTRSTFFLTAVVAAAAARGGRGAGQSLRAAALLPLLFGAAAGAGQAPPAGQPATGDAAPASAAVAASAEAAASAAPRLVGGNPLRPFAAGPGPAAAPWRPALLPNQTKPKTQFRVVAEADGKPALRVEASMSYGNLLHPLRLTVAPSASLSWRWKVDVLNEAADLHYRGSDDTTLKVCTLWDEPIERLPFAERQLLRVARATAREPVPAATICYVWDAKLAEGSELDSPFTHRLRYIVLRRGNAGPATWASERRDIGADFLRLFGSESPTLPPLVGVAVGADADNTQGRSLGYVADLSLEP